MYFGVLLPDGTVAESRGGEAGGGYVLAFAVVAVQVVALLLKH